MLKNLYPKISNFVQKKPLLSFFVLLGLLLGLILASNFVNRPKKQLNPEIQEKKVAVYQIGTVPKLTLQGQVEKAGVVTVTALSGGIVQNIYVKEGDQVSKGKWLVSLASNYQGGNAFSIQRQLAQVQNQNVEDSYPLQKELISKQRELADKTDENSDKLREIAAKSIDESKSLIDLNQDIINSLNDTLNQLEAISSTDSALILSTKAQKSQFLSANNQLKNALRNTEYSQDADKPPAQLANLQKDIALKNLEIQEKAVDLGREISKLQLQLTQINESLMFPAAPFSSTVERIFVRSGQFVSPGTPLMTLSAVVDPPLTVNVYTSREISQKVSKLEPSILTIGSKNLSLYPSYITREAVSGSLFNIIYDIPQELYADLTDKGYIKVQVPVGYPDSGATFPFLPLDCIYQTQDSAYVLVFLQGKAVSKKLVLGQVFGSFVQIESGIESGDQIILDRNVLEAEKVRLR